DDKCQECAPDLDPLKWSPKNGGSCDDGDPCTKDDYCQDGTCRGSDYSKNCTDDLFCTVDCDGKGGCLSKKPIDPKTCLIKGECFTGGAKNPLNCSTCDPGKSQTAWTPTASTCLIDNACHNPGDKNTAGGSCAECDPTVNASGWTVTASTNQCLIGNVCKNPKEMDSIKCGECDPAKDKYNWSPIAGKCKIGGACYSSGDKNTGGCAECDTTRPTLWTVKGNQCLIGNVCKNSQETDANGCQECDPSKDKYAWSAVAGKCKIGASCFSDGATEPKAGCLVCTYAKTPSFWSANSAVSQKAFNFDAATTLPSGLTVEAISGSTTTATWQVVSGKESWSGNNALYYGDAAKMNYATGLGGVALLLKNVALPAGKKAQLVFKTWLDINASGASEEFKIFVGKSPLPSNPPAAAKVWEKLQVPSASYKTWVQQVVDLSALAGQTVDVRIQFIAYQPGVATHQGIFIDDLWFLYGC
ncbi:MAG: hypothetical protein KAI47_26405, partial [Deltaproteobacteria bacterium]|nr:hypothetical protein [Deltaproteobacteria bacterium]